MKNTRVWLAFLVTLCCDTAFSQSLYKCNHIEFAELNTFSKSELESKFCDIERSKRMNKKSRDIENEHIGTLSKLADKYALDGKKSFEEMTLQQIPELKKMINTYTTDLEKCEAESETVSRLLTKRKVTPNC